MAKILVIEDNRGTAKTVTDWLEFQKYQVENAFDGDDGLYRVLNYPYDLIILDWDLPGKSGLEILVAYRSARGRSPILMLTGKDKIDNKELGFDSGADDYLTKPFELKELSARVRALLRRPAELSSNVITVGDLELDRNRSTVTKSGKPLSVTPIEFAILDFFMTRPAQIIKFDAMIDQIWSSDSEATLVAARTAIARLRKKIDSPGEKTKIENVHGFGYRFNG